MKDHAKVVNNVFVCCKTSAGACDHVADAIRGLGRVSMVYSCCWYLETPLGASEIKLRLAPVLSEADTVVVVDATNHQAAWRNIRPDAAERIRETWSNGSLPSYLQGIPPRRNSRDLPDDR